MNIVQNTPKPTDNAITETLRCSAKVVVKVSIQKTEQWCLSSLTQKVFLEMEHSFIGEPHLRYTVENIG
jgi:hypothetical protein